MTIDRSSYLEIENTIENQGSEFSAAEVHGLITGMLCLDPALKFHEWAGAANIRDFAEHEHAHELMDLFADTRDRLSDDGFEFCPLLPDDDESISKRAAALSEWCGGFLYGLGCLGKTLSWPESCREILSDFAAISNVDPESSEDEDDEEALMELIEYVRVAVELLRVELQSANASAQVQQSFRGRRDLSS